MHLGVMTVVISSDDSSTHKAIYVYISKHKALFGIATVLVIYWMLHFHCVFYTSVVVLAPSDNIAPPVAHSTNSSQDWTQQLAVLHCTCTCFVTLHWNLHVASITSSVQVFACMNPPSRPQRATGNLGYSYSYIRPQFQCEECGKCASKWRLK